VLFRLDGVSRSFGARCLFRDLSLNVRDRDRIGLVGSNGAGKTTLLRIAASEETPDEGRVLKSNGVRVGLLRQEIDPRGDRSVRQEVATVFRVLEQLEREMRELEQTMERCASRSETIPEELSSRYDRCHAAFDFGGGFQREARVERVLEGLGFEEESRSRPLASFSGGWLMRVELAKLLLAAPDVLLLDEPTNHLDLPSIQWFEETIDAYAGAILMISHDRTFLKRHVTRVAELENGTFTVYEGGYDRYLRQKTERREHLEAQRRTQDRQIAHAERFIERFRAKATKARQVQARIKSLQKLDRIEPKVADRGRIRLRISEPERSGDIVLRLEEIHKRFGDQVVYQGINFEIRRGDRVALVGPNGAGKSTLLRIAAGVLPFEAGRRIPGHHVEVGFYAQHQLDALRMECTVLKELERAARTEDFPRLRRHLGAFLFSGDDIEKKVEILSGGEKARLALARMLLRPANFLVLDEPTNHLDVAAREVLEQGLRGYTGTVILVSHDRSFINALVNRVVEVRAGQLTPYVGNYDDYLRRSRESEPSETSMDPTTDSVKLERIAARNHAKQRLRALERKRKRLRKLEDEIASLESRLEQLGWKLGDPTVYRDPEQVRNLRAEREAGQNRVDALYRDWEQQAAEIEDQERALE